MWRQSRERFEDADLEDWSDAATSQGMPADTRSWKNARNRLPLRLQRECSPADTFIQPSDTDFEFLI